MDDFSLWNRAAVDRMQVLSPSVKAEPGTRRLRRKTGSKLLLLYNRISGSDLMSSNLARNDRIVQRNCL